MVCVCSGSSAPHQCCRPPRRTSRSGTCSSLSSSGRYVAASAGSLAAMLLAGVISAAKSDVAVASKQEMDGILFRHLVHALCPGIHGHEMVKAGLLLALFGGTSSQSPRPRAAALGRGDIHVLLCGDPGLGKSHLLQVGQPAQHPPTVTHCQDWAWSNLEMCEYSPHLESTCADLGTL